MELNKKTKELAKEIFKKSFENKKLNESLLKKFIRIVADKKTPQSLEILKTLEKILARYNEENTLLVESAFPLKQIEREKIKETFEKTLGKKLQLKEVQNKELISGLKVKLSDNIWENSVLNNLEQLKGMLIS